MNLRRRSGRLGESGQVIVIFALLIPVFFGLGAIVLDVGNWYVHKRALQTQVDAAALAGAGSFIGCFLNPDDPVTGANVAIAKDALRYAGDTRRDPSTENLQVQEPNDVYVALNSKDYWAQANGTDKDLPSPGYGLDYTMPPIDSDGITAPDSKPCSVKALDAKATDDEAPMLWGLLPITASPKAHARVEIFETEELSDFLPFAVPENDPRSVFALFVNEADTDKVDTVKELFKMVPQPAAPSGAEPATVWNGAASIDTDTSEETGMVVLQTTQDIDESDLAGLSLTGMCTKVGAVCFGNIKSGNARITTNRTGVSFIFSQQEPPGPNTAAVRDAMLTNYDLDNLFPASNPSCAQDTGSTPYFLWDGECQVRIRAQIDFGSNLQTPRDVRVQLNGTFGNNCNGGTAQLTKNTVGGLTWYESPWITIPAGSGRNEFRLCWRAGNGGSRRDGNFGNQIIQMAFAANSDLGSSVYSGPLVYAAIGPSHSLTQAPNTGVTVEVGLQPPLKVTNGNDPPILLRLAGTGSLNQLLNCDPSPRQPVDEVYDGCETPYKVNRRNLQCSGPTGSDPTWSPNNLPPTLSPDDPSWITPDCIEANPGDVTAMAKGLRYRWENSATDNPPGFDCPANEWKEFRGATPQQLPKDTDERFITLVIANYGAFDKNGITALPITKFAGFYATGWFVGGGNVGTQGCPNLPTADANDPPPTCTSYWSPAPGSPPSTNGPGCDPSSNRLQGAVWGYYVTQVFPTSFGKPSKKSCKFSELGTCIAGLVE